MGDRFIVTLNCAYCGRLNEDAWYASSCGVEYFVCSFCLKYNRMDMNFRSRKMRQPKKEA